MKLTKYFPCTLPPAHDGWYELRANYQRESWMGNYCDGIWMDEHGEPMNHLNEFPDEDGYRWRGLAKDPNA